MSDGVLIALVTVLGAIGVEMIRQGRKINRISGDTAATLKQTENDHAGAEYPNMRDEITAVRTVVEGLSGSVRGLTGQMGHMSEWIRDVAANTDFVDDTVSRKATRAARELATAIEERNEKFDGLRRELPLIIRREIGQHVADCPLRNADGLKDT